MAATLTARPIDKPIRNKAALAEAIAELDSFIDDDPDEGTPDFDRMELLAILISDYEARTLPPLKVTPQEMVRHTAEQMGVSPGELAGLVGGRSRLSNFYNGIRPLSTGQMINLRDRLKIPADLLLRSKKDSAVIEVTKTVANREKFRRAYEGGLEETANLSRSAFGSTRGKTKTLAAAALIQRRGTGIVMSKASEKLSPTNPKPLSSTPARRK